MSNLLSDLLFTRRGVVDAVATTTFAEVAKDLTTRLAALVVPGEPVLSVVLGATSKEFVQALLKQASSVDRKLDKLLRTPFATGVQLLVEAAGHEVSTATELEARDKLCDNAHLMLRQAYAIAGDTRSDAAFIAVLDAIALGMRQGHRGMAQGTLLLAKSDIQELEQIAEELRKRALWIKRLYMKAEQVFRPDDLGDKPFGHPEQLLYLRWRESELEDAEAAVSGALSRLEVLRAAVSAADAILGMEEHRARHSVTGGSVGT